MKIHIEVNRSDVYQPFIIFANETMIPLTYDQMVRLSLQVDDALVKYDAPRRPFSLGPK